MRVYITSAIIIVALLLTIMAIRLDVFHLKEVPYDDEQSGLNDQILIHFSHVVAENTPKGQAAEKFAELISEKSNGKIVVEIHPNGILYNDDTELQALKDGTIQMIAPTISKMTEQLPNWQVLDLPYVIETNEQLYAALNGEVSEALLKELSKLGIYGLTFWNNGFKQMATQYTPLLEVEDFQNLRVRVMPSEMLREQFQLLNATPSYLTFNDLYRQLLAKQVIAQENTMSNLYSKGFYEIQNKITLSNHGILAYAVMINAEFWDELPNEAKTIINESLAEMKQWQFDEAIRQNKEDLKLLEEMDDVQVYELTERQKTSWKNAWAPLLNEYKGSYYEQLLQEVGNVQKFK